MKRKPITHGLHLLCVLALALSMTTAAFAADPPEPVQPSLCYPTAVTRSEDGGEIRKMYDLGPEDDPAGIPRSDFEQDAPTDEKNNVLPVVAVVVVVLLSGGAFYFIKRRR